MRKLGKTASALFLVFMFPVRTFSYPIPPQTLWDLASSSQRIVVARVEDIQRDSDGEIARLHVIENWKGPFTDVVRVRFWSTMVCPAPPRYIPGREVLAFLEAETSGDNEIEIWRTVGLSYGTLYPREEDRQLLWRLLHRLQTDTRPFSRDFEKDWHVEAASHHVTRWHGLYRLHRRVDFLHSFYDTEPFHDLFESLSADDLGVIARGFLDDPSSDITFPMTLALLHDVRSNEIDTTAVALVEGLLLEEQPPYWTPLSMVLVWSRFGDPDGKKRLGQAASPDGDPLLDIAFSHGDRSELEKAWSAARLELGIPNAAPLVLPQDEMEGVGSLTPP